MSTKTIQHIGVWMDHSEACLVNPDDHESRYTVIRSDKTHHVRIAGETGSGTQLGNYRSTNNEAHMHNKEQEQLNHYFNEIADSLMPYEDVLLFGPTTAAKEFQHFLKERKPFNDKTISFHHSDYLTENQLIAHVKNFFHMKN